MALCVIGGAAAEHHRRFPSIALLAAAEALPAPTTNHQRLVFGRIQALTTKDSQQASASLQFANAQVTALAAQMEVRRKVAAR